ncbi:MAG: ion transporter [Patescibacteria group bacterium]|nr:ion transporter [Patescibacteria group bacterium]
MLSQKYYRLKQKTSDFFENPKTTPAKIIRAIIIILIIFSGIEFCTELFAHDYFIAHEKLFSIIEIITVIIFTAEYLARLWASESRLDFIIKFYNGIDLLAILPFYIYIFDFSFLHSFKLIKLLRASRIFRLAKILRYF